MITSSAILLSTFVCFCFCLTINCFQRGTSPGPAQIKGIREIVNDYDAFLIDQWGVLHDGKKMYDDVLNTLQMLKSAGKSTIMVSNSSKRKKSSVKGLLNVGIDPALYFDNNVITSGEVTFDLLSQDRTTMHQLFPSLVASNGDPLRIFVFGNGEDDDEYVASTGNVVVKSPEQADLVLARGTFSIGPNVFSTAEETMRNVDAALALCKAMRLPMLVSNPDFHRPGSGAAMPGQIAALYRQGNEVVIHYIGKPYCDVFLESLKLLPAGIDKNRICMIGDSMEHDIKGAANFGIGSLFIQNGVHATAIGTIEGSPMQCDQEVLASFLIPHSAYLPSHVIPAFQW